MMRERDIRQETFEEYKDSKQSKLVTFSALTTGVGMLAAFGFGQFSFFFGSAIGVFFFLRQCDWDSLCYPDGNHCPPGAEHAPRPH